MQTKQAYFTSCSLTKPWLLKDGSAVEVRRRRRNRLTVLVGASMMGEKLPLVVVGKSKSPKCFKGIRSVPLDYFANTKAWMTGDLFEDIVKKWNRQFSKEKRNILLIIDNCPAHPRHLSFSNITIKFLPPNTTSKLQPCDQGIIQCLKVHYQYQLVQKKLLAIRICRQRIEVFCAGCNSVAIKIACDEVTSTIIQNCFHHVGFKTDSTPLPEHDTSLDIAGVLEDLRTNGVHVEGQVKDFTNIDSDSDSVT